MNSAVILNYVLLSKLGILLDCHLNLGQYTHTVVQSVLSYGTVGAKNNEIMSSQFKLYECTVMTL